MHEFTLAKNIIEIVEEAIRKNNATLVKKVVLEIGTLSGVEIPALETALECLREGSVLVEANIEMTVVEAIAICHKCENHYTSEALYSPCPKCNSYGSEIISGKELIVKSIIAE
jgi:hydrogenase nickel incorporation protein HypA/HybF